MNIKGTNGNTILSVDINQGAILKQELMKEHYITLPFTLASPTLFRIGSYVDTDFGRFILKDTYKPTRNNTNAGYDYQLRLDAWYYLFANKVVKFMPENDASETTFELTANISTHVQTVMKTVSYLGTLSSLYKYNGTTAISTSIDLDLSSEAKYIKYDSVNVIDAFTQIAEAFDCEWWFVDNVLFFGKCERGNAVTFTHLSNVIMTSSGNKQPFANRIIAFGSERNLPHNYRGSESIVNGIVQKRLMLPESTCPNGYIQTDDVTSESEVVEIVRIYDYVYPKTDCEVSSVTTYTSTVENEDGTTTTVTFYRVKDSSGFDFSTDLILEGETLHIIFQSGLLNGMDFECHYNDDEEYYEVIVNENYGIQLPNETLHPAIGDKFILTGWDATQMASTGIIEDAEEELYTEASKDLAKLRIDPNNYNCDYLADENHTVFPLGQKVELVNPAYFTTTRLSRIIGYEIKLDIPYDHPMYIVGESVAYNRLGTLERMIQQLGVNGALLNEYNNRNWQSIVNYTNLVVGGKLNTIQEQLDHVQVTYFGDYVPALNNEPASTWQSSEYSEHDGDMFYNRTTGKGYEFTYKNGSWGWVEIQDEDIRQALEDAAAAQDTADGKRRVFVTPAGTLPTPPYDENDLWVNATYPSNSTSTDESQHEYYNDILKCITPRAEGATASINDWSLGSKYTDDSSLNAFLNGYTGTLTGIRQDITNAATAASNAQTTANNANTAAAAAQATADALDYLKQAYLADNTLIDHGLILSTIVALRDSNNNVWSGISGAYDSTKLGNGIAAWYGGGMIDKEVSAVSNAAKSLFRFDGSGYVANGNLKWDANGNVTIQGYSINATTLQVGGSNVATQAMLDNFVSKAFFNRLFTAYDANGNAIVPNNTTTAINNLKIMVGAWTEQYLSALGLNSEGGGGGGTGSVNSIKIATNTYLDPDSDGIIDMSSYAANWNDAYNKRHTHSNKSVLDEITSTKVSNWDAVYGVVPSAAYESGNQLADKNFVNSSISTATATYISNNGVPFNSLAELQAYTGQHDKNDYAFVKTTDSAGNTLYNRYKFDGTSWSLEYTLNNSSFTADQWSAINSGITSTHVSKLNGIAAGAQVNVLESVKINGTALSIASKAVNIVTGNGLQSSSNTISILLPSNSGLSVASTGLKLDVVNNLTTSSDYRAISATQAKKIWDLLNQMFTLEGAGTTASPYVIKANYGLYSEQFLSALGQNSSGGGSGDFDEEQMWTALQSTSGTYATTKIATSHIPDMASTYGYLKSSALSGYATQSWVNQQGFLTTHQSIYALTLKAGGTAVTTFTPNSASASLDFVAGTNISLTMETNQITIANTYSYTLPLAASGTRGGVQIGYSETNSGTSSTRNYAVKLSSEKMYVNVPWTDTTYKLTLNGTTNGASGGTSLGSFYAPTASGTANQVLISGGSNTAPSWTAQSNLSVGTAAKLGTGTTTYTAWGQTYWSSGVPQSISGNMTSVGSITPSANGNALGTISARFNIYGTSGNFSGNVSITGTLGVTGATTLSSTLSVAGGITLTTTKRIYFGDTDHYLELDSTGFHFSHGVYSDSFVSALGANSSGGGGGTFDEEAMWEALGTTSTAKVIASSHIPNLSWAKITSGKPTTLSGYGISDAYTKTQVDNALDGYLVRKTYGLDGKTAVRITFNNVNGGIINVRSTLSGASLILVGNGYGEGGTTRNNWVQLSSTTSYFSWCIPTASGIEKSVEIYNSSSNSASVVVAAFDTGVTFTELSALSTTASTVKVAYASDYLPLTGGTLTGTLAMKFDTDTSRAWGYQWKNTSGTSVASIIYHNTAQNIILNPVGSSETWSDAVGKYSLIVGNNSLTYNTYPILHSNNYSSYALPLSGGTITGNLISTKSGTSETYFRATNSNGSIELLTSTNRGVYDRTTTTWLIGTDGTNTWLSQGNVGIGTTSPAYKLDVVGSIRASDGVYVGTGGAAGNSYVTSDEADNIYLRNSSGAVLVCDGKVVRRGTTLSDVTLGSSSYPWLAAYATTFYGALSGNATTATTASKLSTTSKTAWGQTYWTSGGVPTSISGNLSDVGNITADYYTLNNTSANPYLKLTHTYNSTNYNYYIQAYTGLLYLGAGSANSMAINSTGQVFLAGHLFLNGAQAASSTGNTTQIIFRESNTQQVAISSNSSALIINPTSSTTTKQIVLGVGSVASTFGNSITCNGEVTASSDGRKKNIISNTKFNVKDIASARSVLFEWNDGRDDDMEKKIHGGSIAQDWLGKADSFLMQDEDGFYSINYGALALCSAITIAREVLKHEDEITRLKKVVVKQAKEIVDLKNKVRELEERRIA